MAAFWVETRALFCLLWSSLHVLFGPALYKIIFLSCKDSYFLFFIFWSDICVLIYFISKISICDYFRISEHAYKNLPVEEKENMFNRYYNELYEKYYGTGHYIFFILLFLYLLSAIFCLISVLLVLAISL